MSITQRGMSMRSMSNRKGRQRAEAPPDDHDQGDDQGGGLELDADDGVLEDQGDGVRVLRRVRSNTGGEGASRDLPDEPPPGWGEP